MRIVVADDAVLLREGLVRILVEEGHEVCAAVGSGPDVIRAFRAYLPDLVITDVRMPPTHSDDGIAAAREIRSTHPDAAIVLLSQHIQAIAAMDLFQANPAGLGYLLKDRVLQIDDFLASVRRVAGGGTAVDPDVVAQLVGTNAPTRDALSNLTERETNVLALMAEGLSNTGIGDRIHVGVRTVETYVGAVFAKLDLQVDAEEHRRVKAVLAYLAQREPNG